MSKLDRLVIGAQMRVAKAVNSFKNFMKEEKGISAVVATIILLLIVVIVIGIFWDRLKIWLNDMMDQIFNFKVTP